MTKDGKIESQEIMKVPSEQVKFVTPWQAALWRAFGNIEPIDDLLPRSFDQGTVKLLDENDSAYKKRLELHRRFDLAEREVMDALATEALSASGSLPIREDGQRGFEASLICKLLSPVVFRRHDLAFGPTGEVRPRVGVLAGLFCALHLRGTEADLGVPLFYNVRIPVADLFKVWPQNIRFVTIKDERDLQRWLEGAIRESPDRSPGKPEMKRRATKAGLTFTGEGFLRAWSNAVAQTGATAWSKAGRKLVG